MLYVLIYIYIRHVAEQRGIEIHVDSAGTAAYHVGEDPDDR